MKTQLLALSLGASLIAGCASLQVGALGRGDASLSVVTAVRDGQLRTQTAGFLPYTKATINHVVLKLYTLAGQNQDVETPVMSGNAQVQADVPSQVIDQPITFQNLHHDTTYRIKAYAYKAVGTATGDLISTEDAASYRDVTVGTSLTPAIASIPLKLIDRVFRGEASSSLLVTDGQLSHEDEVISVPPAPAQTFALTIAGHYPNFTLNGAPFSFSYYTDYTPAATQATASVLITNTSNSYFDLYDVNNGNAWLGAVPNGGATRSVTISAQSGAFNVRISEVD